MLPTGGNAGWATEVIETVLLYPRNDPKILTVAFCLEQGADILRKVEIVSNSIILYASDGVTPVLTLAAVSPIRVDLTFDQLNRPMIVWESPNSAIWLYWYNSLVSAYVQVNIATGTNPCCMIDERRSILSSISDNFLFYQRTSVAYYRMERERYLVEHTIPSSMLGLEIETCGMGVNQRMTLRISGYSGVVLQSGDTSVGVDNQSIGYDSGVL